MAKKGQVTTDAGIIEQGAKVVYPGKVVSKGRSAQEVIRAFAQADSLEEISLTGEEIKGLIDVAAEVDERRRAIDKETKEIVTPAKAILKLVAELENKKHLEGHKGVCDIKASTETITGTATELAKLLKKEGKTKLFNELVSIKITESKKFLGEDILFKSKFFQSKRTEYGTVSLKLKK